MGWLKKVTKGAGDWFSGKGGFSLMDDFKDWYDGTDAARKQMQMQDQYNMKYWNLQNAYNHPAEQMKRYQEAGLNPNLIYGQSNTASPIGSVSAGNIESGAGVLGKAAQTVASFYNLKALAAQVANMRQQNKNLQAQDTLLGSQADFTREQARRYAYDTDWLKEHGLSTFSPTIEKNGTMLGGTLDKTISGFTDGSYLGKLKYISPYIFVTKLANERLKNFRENLPIYQSKVKDFKERTKQKMREVGVKYIKYKSIPKR